MTANELLKAIDEVETIDVRVDYIENMLSAKVPEIIKKIVSLELEDYFLENEMRLMNYSDIIHVDGYLNSVFFEKKLIPIVDCYDGDFIVYDSNTTKWSMYNIYDHAVFDEKESLEIYLLGGDYNEDVSVKG